MSKKLKLWEFRGMRQKARTKSEARAQFKYLLALKRIPAGEKVTLVGESEEEDSK